MTGKLLAFCSLPPYPDPSLVTFDPEVPMDFPLQPLVPGTIIELTGHVHNHTKRFSINLVTGKGDIALHVNPRFDAGNTVFNTLRGNEWETEEVVQSVPVQQGQNFECMILVEQMDYKVAFNGMHFAEFKHRLLFSLVERLNVEGTVTIHTAEQKPPLGTVLPPMEGVGMAMPCTAPVMLPTGPATLEPANEPQTVYNPPTPFSHLLPGGRLAPGLMVYISGRPHSEAVSFSVNFACGGVGSDVAFHFNPRFRHKEVVRNTFIDGDWGPEEKKCHKFVFHPGVHFDMLVQVLPDRFNVAVNGQHYVEYQHRLQPLSRISHITVEGDVLIASCRCQYA
ncbi:unnamed protein product [Ixodes persulcatus]